MYDIKEFHNISIKGRFAYGICCLENAILHFGFDTEKWKEVLEAYWAWPPMTEYADQWSIGAWSHNPIWLKETSQYRYDEENLRLGPYDETKFYRLKKMFDENSNTCIIDLIDNVFSINGNDLLELIWYPGEESLKP